ncbi:transcription antiterminator BglG [Floricoccus tropicus]|uniref:Transcription antiterminator BglG n=1 Tax=Floricoccus tropicus TaxID=1859473 RepID=A0A1E8GJ26_9LACT|nr:PRD domain-containing protein [Floricoccus tropicus]OFI48254.1 transcription antiterminator BglG [Floricoccus tropicus]
MIIEKILNNNVLLTSTETGQELVCMGKGLAFQKKVGQEVEVSKVEKEFVLKDNKLSNQFQDLLADIPIEEFDLVKKLIDIAEFELDKELSLNIYFTLMDHIHYALERVENNIEIPNLLSFEIKKFYSKEYQIAKKLVSIIEKEFNVSFTSDEAGFIALHLVNSQQKNGDMIITMEATKLLRDILKLINNFVGIKINEESLKYQRLVTHLQFFVYRYLEGQENQVTDEDEFLYGIVSKKYKEAFDCVEFIDEFLKSTNRPGMDKSEKTYLAMHINRIIN